MAELRHGPGFDLTNSFPRQIEVLTHLFERSGLTPVESEAKTQDLAFAVVERRQQPTDLIGSSATAAASKGDSAD